MARVASEFDSSLDDDESVLPTEVTEDIMSGREDFDFIHGGGSPRQGGLPISQGGPPSPCPLSPDLAYRKLFLVKLVSSTPVLLLGRSSTPDNIRSGLAVNVPGLRIVANVSYFLVVSACDRSFGSIVERGENVCVLVPPPYKTWAHSCTFS